MGTLLFSNYGNKKKVYRSWEDICPNCPIKLVSLSLDNAKDTVTIIEDHCCVLVVLGYF